MMMPHAICNGTGYIQCLRCRGKGKIREWEEAPEATPPPSAPMEDVDFTAALLTPILKQKINEARAKSDITPERKASLDEALQEFVDAESLPLELRVPRMRQIIEKYARIFGLGYLAK